MYTVLAPVKLEGKMADNETMCRGIGMVVDMLVTEFQLLLRRKQRRKRRWWVQDWIKKRSMFGVSKTLLEELRLEDKESYRSHLRICEEQFNYLLSIVKPLITKEDTIMREALPADLKLQITLRYLATGDHFQLCSTCTVCPRHLFPDVFLKC
jgi:hypothetical protein